MKTILVLFFFSLTIYLPAQHRFEHIDIKDGLTENSVTDIFQDSEGYLWFATQDGISQYNGYVFKNYNVSSNDSTTLSDNFLWNICEDSLGFIWACSRDGINRIDKRTGIVYRFYIDNSGLENGINEVNTALFHKGFLYCYLYSGIYRIPVKAHYEGIVNSINDRILEIDTSSFVYGLFKDKANAQLFYIKDDGLVNLDTQEKISSKQFQQDNKGKFFRAFQAANSNLWFNSTDNIYILNSDTDTLGRFEYNFDGAHINRLLLLKEEIWVSTNKGIYIFNYNKQLKYHLVHNQNIESSLSSNFTTDVMQDESGKIWVASGSNGISLYHPKREQFKFLADETLQGKYLVKGIVQNQKHLIISTSKGVFAFDLESSALTSSTFASNQIKNITQLKVNNIAHLNGTKLALGFKEDILLGTSGNGLLVFDNDLKFKKRTSFNKLAPVANVISEIIVRNSNEIWLTAHGGLFVLDSNYQVKRSYTKENSNLTTLYFLAAINDSENNLWLGANHGAFKYIDKTDSFEAYPYIKDQLDKSPAFTFLSGFADLGDGNLWIATYGGGLSKLDKKNKSFEHFNTNHGLANNVCNGILSDQNKNLWINTNKGLSKFNTNTNDFINYSLTDGLHFNEFSLGSFYKNKAGEMFFGTLEGLVLFNPEDIQLTTHEPLLVINKVEINYENESNRLVNNSIELYPEDKSITFHFSGLNFSNSPKIKYRFKLEGYNDDWIETDALIATYTSIPDGDYTFKVNVTNEDGIWNKEAIQLDVTVHPPIYKAWWFILLCSIFVISLSIYIIRHFAQRKIKKKLRQLEIQQAVQNEKERISRDLHDNIGSQITYLISSIDQESYKKKEDQAIFEKLSDKARSMMTQLRNTIWVINKEKISLYDFSQKIRDYTSRILEPSAIISTVEFDKNQNTSLSPILVSNLFRIVQEAVNNSIKHSEASQINVDIYVEKKKLIVTLQDNGIGIKEPTDKTDHYGLKNMMDRAAEFKGKLEIKNQNGCRIEISIPLN